MTQAKQNDPLSLYEITKRLPFLVGFALFASFFLLFSASLCRVVLTETPEKVHSRVLSCIASSVKLVGYVDLGTYAVESEIVRDWFILMSLCRIVS